METLTEKLERIRSEKAATFGDRWGTKSSREKNLLVWDAWHKERCKEGGKDGIKRVMALVGVGILAGAAVLAAQLSPAPIQMRAEKTEAAEVYTVQALAPESVVERPWHVIEGVTVYHYCACAKCCGKSVDNPAYGVTRSGTVATAGRTIAVDPDIIPLGSEVVVNGNTYIAEDTGGAIKGYTVDIYCESHGEALEKGMYQTEIKWREGEKQ